MEDDMYNRGLTGLAKCVNFFDSNEIFTPDEIITSLRAWYHKMVSTIIKRYVMFDPLSCNPID